MTLQLAVILVAMLGPPALLLIIVLAKEALKAARRVYGDLMDLEFPEISSWAINTSSGFFLAGTLTIARPFFLWVVDGVLPKTVFWSMLAGGAGIVLSFYFMAKVARVRKERGNE